MVSMIVIQNLSFVSGLPNSDYAPLRIDRTRPNSGLWNVRSGMRLDAIAME